MKKGRRKDKEEVMTKYCVVTTTCDKTEIANKIMNTLLEKRLVSCCQMTKVESSYWWEGEIVKESELLTSQTKDTESP